MLRSALRQWAQALTRRPSPARKPHRARRWQPALEELEPRLVPTVTVSILNGVLTAQADSTFNVVTVDHSGFGAAVINGRSFADASYNSIRINGGAGGLLANLRGNVKPLTVVGASSKTVDILGDTSNRLQGIQAPVLLENVSGQSRVIINDQGDTTAQGAFLSTVPRAGASSLGQVSVQGAAPIQFDYAATRAVNLNLGTRILGVSVLGTGVTTNVFISSAARILVGDGGSLAGIQGALNLETEAGGATVSIDDQSDLGNPTATLATVTRPNQSSLGQLTGLSAPITWDYRGTSGVSIFGGGGTFNFQGTVVPTVLFTNSNATINIGNAGLISGIQGALGLVGALFTSQTINIDDSSNAFARTVTLDTLQPLGQGVVNAQGAAQIEWDASVALNLQLGSGDSTVNVRNTPAVTTNIFNSGVAAINVGSGGSIFGIRDLHLENEAGAFDTVNIDDSTDADNQTVNVSTIARPGDSSLGAVSFVNAFNVTRQITFDYADTQAVNLNLGSGDTTVNVTGTGVTTNIVNSAAATVNVVSDVSAGGSINDIRGALNLSGPDTINIADPFEPVGHRTVTVSTITRPGASSLGAVNGLAPAQITWDYANTKVVTINVPNFDDFPLVETTVNVLGTGVTTNIHGNGPLIVNIGDGTVSDIKGDLNLTTETVFDQVNILDSNDPTLPHDANFDNHGDSMPGFLTGLAPAAISWIPLEAGRPTLFCRFECKVIGGLEFIDIQF
jgi:hypothetical protein